jgi:hypothetical protein
VNPLCAKWEQRGSIPGDTPRACPELLSEDINIFDS